MTQKVCKVGNSKEMHQFLGMANLFGPRDRSTSPFWQYARNSNFQEQGSPELKQKLLEQTGVIRKLVKDLTNLDLKYGERRESCNSLKEKLDGIGGDPKERDTLKKEIDRLFTLAVVRREHRGIEETVGRELEYGDADLRTKYYHIPEWAKKLEGKVNKFIGID